jgi:hypothetical protein
MRQHVYSMGTCVCVETFNVQVQNISGYLADTRLYKREKLFYSIANPLSPPFIPPLLPCSPLCACCPNRQPFPLPNISHCVSLYCLCEASGLERGKRIADYKGERDREI